MRLLQKHHRSISQQGFTLVEMLVVAPIVLLVLAGLIGAMVAMVGDSLASSGRATIAYNMQDSLDRIEQDTRIATSFLGTFASSGNFASPQGRDGGTASFSTSSNDLILTQQATTASPYDGTRNLVYYANKPNACTDPTSNQVLYVHVIYFLRNGSLWRRTIVPTWNTNTTVDTNTVCSAPWQRDTCAPGATLGTAPTANCNSFDEDLLDNVSAFTLTFSADPAAALSVSISITTSTTISGTSVSQTSVLYATRSNSVVTDN